MQIFFSVIVAVVFMGILYPAGAFVLKTLKFSKDEFFHVYSILLGFAFFSLIALPFYAFELDVRLLTLAVVSTAIIVTAPYARGILIRWQAYRSADRLVLNKSNSIIVITVFSSILVLFNETTVDLNNVSADYWYYAAQATFYNDTGRLSNLFPYFGAINSAYPFSGFLALLAVVEILTGMEPILILDSLTGPFIVAFIYTNFCVIRSLNFSTKIALLALFFVFAVFYQWYGSPSSVFFSYPFYPKLFSLSIFPTLLLLIFTNENLRSRRGALFVFLMVFGFLNLHVQNILWLVIILPSCVLLRLMLSGNNWERSSDKWKGLENILIGVSFAALVEFFLVFNLLYSEKNALSNFTPSVSDFGLIKEFFGYKLADFGAVFSHGEFLKTAPLQLLIIGLLLVSGYRWFAIFYISVFITMCLLILNPFFLSLLFKFAPVFVLERFSYVLPFLTLVILGVSVIIKKINIQDKYYIPTLCLLFLSFVLQFDVGRDWQRQDASEEYLKFVSENIPINSRVVTDGKSSFVIPAVRDVGDVYIQESFLQGHIAEEDAKNVSALFSKGPDLAETVRLLKLTNYDFLVLNKNLSENKFIEEAMRGLRVNAIFENQRYTVFQK